MLYYGAEITDKVVEVDPLDIPPWEFETPQDHSYWRAQAPSLEALINELVAKAPPPRRFCPTQTGLSEV